MNNTPNWRAELEESEKARANQNIHVRTVKSTRTEHKCNFCRHMIDLNSHARVVTEEILNTFINKVLYKTHYYHDICFVQTYPDYRPDYRHRDKEQ